MGHLASRAVPRGAGEDAAGDRRGAAGAGPDVRRHAAAGASALGDHRDAPPLPGAPDPYPPRPRARCATQGLLPRRISPERQRQDHQGLGLLHLHLEPAPLPAALGQTRRVRPGPVGPPDAARDRRELQQAAPERRGPAVGGVPAQSRGAVPERGDGRLRVPALRSRPAQVPRRPVCHDGVGRDAVQDLPALPVRARRRTRQAFRRRLRRRHDVRRHHPHPEWFEDEGEETDTVGMRRAGAQAREKATGLCKRRRRES
mmetsp:Transcript_37047/g.74985  ORF Transcript_37047/g.74985 Transcript_37047/m.74985 type:complete len:258 (-) Transcript_37047:112-885(-)